MNRQTVQAKEEVGCVIATLEGGTVIGPKLVKTKNPSWKALVSTFICWARIWPPTRMLCLPRIISSESAIDEDVGPALEGCEAAIAQPPVGSATVVAVMPQLTQSVGRLGQSGRSASRKTGTAVIEIGARNA